MTACEKCWNDAYRLAQMLGRHQADEYQRLIADNPNIHGHAPTHPDDATTTTESEDGA